MAAGVVALGAMLVAVIGPVAHVGPPAPAILPASATAADGNASAHLLYGRVTTEGAVFEGRLRWGGDQEALWGNYFNGAKSRNPWFVYAPKQLHDRARLFMARFGDITRIDRYGREWRITLKSGAVVHLGWGGADDMNDGVRVWDSTRGIVNLPESRIRTIEFLATSPRSDSARPLYGTVHTRQGDFTGFVQWNRTECLDSDTLDGRTADGALSMPFDTIRSIARHSPDSSLATLVDGKRLVLSGNREVGGEDNGGIYVDDQRYGRVLISWNAFDRVDFSPGGDGPGYGNFPPGRPLTGSVITQSGRRLAGRLIYDLDESETTETLDAPAQGVDYTITFGLVASILVPSREEVGAQRVKVILRSGEELQLERMGDLGQLNTGILVFVDGHHHPEYVAWTDVKEVHFDSPRSTTGS